MINQRGWVGNAPTVVLALKEGLSASARSWQPPSPLTFEYCAGESAQDQEIDRASAPPFLRVKNGSVGTVLD